MKHRITEQHTHPKYPRLVVDLRSKSKFYQARTFLDGRLKQHSTKSTQLTTALKIAEEWYRGLLRESDATTRRHPISSINPTMSEKFSDYRDQLQTQDQRAYADQKWSPIRSFWCARAVKDITIEAFHDFYKWRRRRDKVSNHTLHKDTTLIRQILKDCAETGVLKSFPVIPKIGKIVRNPRRWFNRTEWKHLISVSNERIKQAAGNRKLLEQRQACHDFMIFMTHSMMRVDEVRGLTFGDCRLSKNKAGADVLICDVRKSKTGPRPNVVCMSGAAGVYRRRLGKHELSDLIFPHTTTDAFRHLLIAAGLYVDPDGHKRNLRSLRATGISFRVLAGANVALIAKNSGTSMKSIDDFYTKYLRSSEDIDSLTQMRRQ